MNNYYNFPITSLLMEEHVERNGGSYKDQNGFEQACDQPKDSTPRHV